MQDEESMFTGIVEEIGRVRSVTPQANGVGLDILAAAVTKDLRVGASVAVDGVCQTVLEAGDGWFRVAAETETLRVTTLGRLRPGGRVNLERALVLGGRLDGHLVLGHVDGRGRLVGVRQDERTHVFEIEAPAELRAYVAPKGCIAVDGVSLTVGPWVRSGRFELYLIPHTWEHTTLQERRPGDEVNLEADVLARYVLHLARGGESVRQDLSWEGVAQLLGGASVGGTSGVGARRGGASRRSGSEGGAA